MVLLAAAVTAVAAVTAQLRCVDAAREAALAAARGDAGAVAAGQRLAPDGASITVQNGSQRVQAVVTAEVQPFGGWLPALRVSATAVAEPEPGEPGAAP